MINIGIGRSLILALAVVSVQPLLAKPEATKWVGTWASSPLLDAHAKNAEELLAATTQSGATLREVIHVSIGGDLVREVPLVLPLLDVLARQPLDVGGVEDGRPGLHRLQEGLEGV